MNLEQTEELIEKACKWDEYPSNNIFLAAMGTKSHKKIPSGFYSLFANNQGIGLKKNDLVSDDYFDFDDLNKKIINDIEVFQKSKHLFEKCGLIYKRGIILHGPPGSGKTSIVKKIMQNIVDNDGVVISFFDDVDLLKDVLKAFRKIEPNRQLMVLMEDFEDIVEKEGETQLLNLLDGADQIDGIIYLATTNYLDRIKDRFANRPSRFDVKYLIEMSAKSKLDYVKFLCGKFKIKHEKFTIALNKKENAALLKKLSIAQLKELIISQIVFNQDITKQLKELKD